MKNHQIKRPVTPIRNVYSAIEKVGRGVKLHNFVERIEMDDPHIWRVAVDGATVFYRATSDVNFAILKELQKLEALCDASVAHRDNNPRKKDFEQC